MIDKRKNEHILLAQKAQAKDGQKCDSLYYEPLLGAHPAGWKQAGLEKLFLGKSLKAPLWISSMTGGSSLAGPLNFILAEACSEFGLGMGLGSMRPLLDSKNHFSDFNLRPILGKDLPLWGNIGLAQVEELLQGSSLSSLDELCESLELDGLMVHINPLQEWVQPEGDRWSRPGIEILLEFEEQFTFPYMLKGVGQGMGPKSIQSLKRLQKIKGIELGAWGGTNFSLLESLRREEDGKHYQDLSCIGHAIDEMMGWILQESSFFSESFCVIVSGGLKDLSKGWRYVQDQSLNCILGQGLAYLKAASQSKQELHGLILSQLNTLAFYKSFCESKELQ